MLDRIEVEIVGMILQVLFTSYRMFMKSRSPNASTAPQLWRC